MRNFVWMALILAPLFSASSAFSATVHGKMIADYCGINTLSSSTIDQVCIGREDESDLFYNMLSVSYTDDRSTEYLYSDDYDGEEDESGFHFHLRYNGEDVSLFVKTDRLGYPTHILGRTDQSFSANLTKIERSQFINYKCEATQGRQQGTKLKVDGTIEFEYQTAGEKAEIRKVAGYVIARYSFDEPLPEFDQYVGVFNGSYGNKVGYKPTTYKDHYKFENFDAAVTNRHDGGGMWGYLVLNKNLDDEIDAHYVFKAGDHMGGTIDFSCRQ